MVKNNKKAPEVAEAPVVKSGGASTLFVLFLFVLVGVGCGVGYQQLLEQMQLHNANLVGTIAGLKEELASVKESYASINFENEIAAIGQMKEDLQQTRLQINTEADKVSQVKAGLSVVKTNLEGLSKDVHDARESSKSSDLKTAGALDTVAELQTAVAKLAAASEEEKSAIAAKLAQATSALEAQAGSTTERINAVESGLASQISAATQQAVEAKQLAEESQKAAASSAQSSADELNDKLEQIRQNVAYLLDAKKGDDEKQADLVEKIEGVAAGGLKKSDLEGLSGQIAELQSGLAAVKKETEGQGKSLQDSVRSFEGKVNKLNANIKMTSNEVSGIREMVTNMVADAEPATEAPSEE